MSTAKKKTKKTSRKKRAAFKPDRDGYLNRDHLLQLELAAAKLQTAQAAVKVAASDLKASTHEYQERQRRLKIDQHVALEAQAQAAKRYAAVRDAIAATYKVDMTAITYDSDTGQINHPPAPDNTD